MPLPEEYSVQKFLQLAGYPKTKQRGRVIEGGCPICREGNSWGKKRRLYYMVTEGYIYCHNCGFSGDPLKFILQADTLTFEEVMRESSDYDMLPRDIDKKEIETRQVSEHILPDDCINLCDDGQIKFYSDNSIVNRVCDFVTQRKLMTACNRPKTLWVSLSDFIHKNRLILPFYDVVGDIVFYQSRTVIKTERLPKYLSKSGSEKSLFNVDRIDPELDKLFILEGPIDACFIKNGVAVAGIQEGQTSLTARQKEQLDMYTFFDKIWVLDSQWQDKAAKKKTEILLEQGESVFIWPENYGRRFKDFNDMAIALDINEIPYNFVIKNTYTGLKGRIIMGQI